MPLSQGWSLQLPSAWMSICPVTGRDGWVGWRSILVRMPLISRMRSGRVQDKVRRLEEQMRTMNSKIDAMASAFEARRADDEADAIAAERIRSSAADHTVR